MLAFGTVIGFWSWKTDPRGKTAVVLLAGEVACVLLMVAPFAVFPLGIAGILGLLVLAPATPLYAGAAV